MRLTDLSSKYAAFLMLLGLIFNSINASPIEVDFAHCETKVFKWASSALDFEVREDKRTLRDLLFFLHVPRTGGRTYFHCFLKKLYSSDLECPRSYDKLRFDPSKPNCRLLVTHDDYSMMSKLPKEKTSVVTILRNPIDRVFSTYEFSVEVAARFLVHPNLTSATHMAGRLRSKTNGVSTLDIWPWKYLVPWMREDLFARRDARTRRGPTNYQNNDSYNMEDTVMPLHEYINDAVAHDIIHNGATFQVAGLTNNSYFAESHEVRHCIQLHQSLGEYVLKVAKKRLDNMLYVGLTEDHRESASMFANVVGSQIISQLVTSSSKPGVSHNKSGSDSNNKNQQNDVLDNTSGTPSSGNVSTTFNKNMTVGELMEAYESCISSLRKAQSRRRISSLKRISPANFSKEARLKVPESLLQQIASLNRLDIELYKHAQSIFAQQHKHVEQKLEMNKGMLKNLESLPGWEFLSIAIFSLLLLFLVYQYVNARRTSKLKV